MRSIRTCTRSCGRTPRHLIVLSGDHVYKMDYSRMLRFHQEREAAVTLAAIEVPIAEAQPLRHRRDRRRRIGSSASRRSRRTRSRFRARPTSRWRRWASTSSTPMCSCARSSEARRRNAAGPPTPRLRQGHHPGAHPRGAGLRLSVLRREQEGVEVLARHRHPRRLLRSQHGSVPGEPGVQPVRSRVAAADVSAAGAAGEVRVRRERTSGAARRSIR